jgi:hypothetical protein
MHDRMIVLARDRTAGTGRLTPIGAGDVLPPLRDPAAARDIGGRDEHHRPGSQQLLGHARMGRRVEAALRQRDVSRRRHEFAKLRIGHLVAIDPEAVDAHDVAESLLRPLALGAHDERSTADERHSGVVVVVRWQAGIGCASSELAASRALLRDGESADHQTCRAEADATHQQATACHGGPSCLRQFLIRNCTCAACPITLPRLRPLGGGREGRGASCYSLGALAAAFLTCSMMLLRL